MTTSGSAAYDADAETGILYNKYTNRRWQLTRRELLTYLSIQSSMKPVTAQRLADAWFPFGKSHPDGFRVFVSNIRAKTGDRAVIENNGYGYFIRMA